MDIYEAEALPRTGLVFSSEFVPNAGAVWSRLWKIRAFLIIGRFTTRQSVLSSEMGGWSGGQDGRERKRKKKKEPNLKRWGEQGKESNESCVSYISSGGTDVLCQCLICMAISKEKINRRLHSCPLVFCGHPGSGIALGTGSRVLRLRLGLWGWGVIYFKLVCSPAIQLDYRERGDLNGLFSCASGWWSVVEQAGCSAPSTRGLLSTICFDTVSSTFSRVSVALCQNMI